MHLFFSIGSDKI